MKLRILMCLIGLSSILFCLTFDALAQSCGLRRIITDHHYPVGWLVKLGSPIYPKIAKAARIEGVVQVEVSVDRTGKVAKACIVEGHPLLRDAAIKAAKKSKFNKNFGESTNIPQSNNIRLATDIITYNFKLS